MIQYTTPTLQDVEEIFLLGKKEFHWIFEKISWDHELVNWYIKKHSPYCFVAQKDNSIVGFQLSFIKNEIGYMGWICVLPKFRKNSIADTLLEMSIKKFKANKNVKNIFAHVRNDGICVEWLKRRGLCAIKQEKFEMKLSIT